MPVIIKAKVMMGLKCAPLAGAPTYAMRGTSTCTHTLSGCHPSTRASMKTHSTHACNNEHYILHLPHLTCALEAPKHMCCKNALHAYAWRNAQKQAIASALSVGFVVLSTAAIDSKPNTLLAWTSTAARHCTVYSLCKDT